MHRIHSQRKLSPSAASSPSHDYAVTTITVSNQQNPSQSITTSATTLTVGRNPRSSTLCLSDPSISASHAAFNFVNNNWTISDAGSLNGTFLNKVRLEPHAPYRLSSDDVVHFGGDPSDFKVYFSSHSLDLSSTSFPRGSLSIAKSKSFCDRLNERIEEEEEARRREREEDMEESFASWSDGRIECGAASRRGKNKKDSEDRYCMVCLDAQQEERNKQQQHQFMVGVFDGHCGAGAAEEAMEAIQEEVRDLVRDVNDTEAFVRAFLATDDRIQDEAGCTATCVTIFQHDQGGEIEIRAANVGDSMAYMASIDRDEDEVDVDDKKSIDIYTTLTQDHRLSNPEERGRLQSHGVIPEGESTTYRLYGLNLARALGDRFLKDEDLGLSAEPHVSDAITLGGDQEALIVIASDGLWDVMSADDAMDLARQVDRDSHGGVVKVASALVREAEALGSKDDVTVVACRVWSNEATANFSRAFGSGLDGLGRVDGHVDLDKGARGRRAASKADDVSDVDDDLAVGFGGMLL